MTKLRNDPYGQGSVSGVNVAKVFFRRKTLLYVRICYLPLVFSLL